MGTLKDVRTGIRGNKSLYAILSFIAVIIVLSILYKIYKASQTGANIIGNALGADVISVQTGIPAVRVKYIQETAQELWTSHTTTHLFDTFRSHDTQSFIDAINAMGSVKEVLLLDESYKEASGQRLKVVLNNTFFLGFNKEFSASDLNKINSNWLAALKT